jgi:hypothetical protein
MERIHRTDMGIKYGTYMGIKYGTDGDKMRPFDDVTS